MGYRRHTEKEINDFALEVVNGVEEDNKKQEEKARLLKKIEDREKAEKGASGGSSSAESFSLSPSLKGEMFDNTVERFALQPTLEKVGDTMQESASKPKSTSDILALGRGPINYDGAVEVNSVDDIIRNSWNSEKAFNDVKDFDLKPLGDKKGYLSSRKSLGKLTGEAKSASDYLTTNKDRAISRLKELGAENPEEEYNALLEYSKYNADLYGNYNKSDKKVNNYYNYILTGNPDSKGDYDAVVEAAEGYKKGKGLSLKKYSDIVSGTQNAMRQYAMVEMDELIASGGDAKTLSARTADLRRRASETGDTNLQKALRERADAIDSYALYKGIYDVDQLGEIKTRQEGIKAENEDAATLYGLVNDIIAARNGEEVARNDLSPYSLSAYATTTRGKAVIKYLEDNDFSDESLKRASEMLKDYVNDYDKAKYLFTFSETAYYDSKWSKFEKENAGKGIPEYSSAYNAKWDAIKDEKESKTPEEYMEAGKRGEKAEEELKKAGEELRKSGFDKKTIDEYTEYLSWKRNQKSGAEFEEEISNRIDWYMGKNEDGNNANAVVGTAGVIGENALTIATNIAGSLYTPIHWITEGFVKDSDKPYNKYGNPFMTYTNAVRDETGENITNDFGREFYYTAMSSLDSLAAFYAGGVIGKALGAAGASASVVAKASSFASSAIIGLSSAESSAIDVTARGGTREQALASGFVAGIFEGLFESWSIGNFNALKKTGLSGGKNLVKDLAKSIAVNADEELNTEIANIASDYLINGGLSQYGDAVRTYYFCGMSIEDAKKEAAVQMGWQAFDAAKGGAMQAFLMGGFGVAARSIRRRNVGSMFRRISQTDEGRNARLRGLFEDAEYLPATSPEYANARKFIDEYRRTGKLSDGKVGELAEITSRYFSEHPDIYRKAHVEEYAFSEKYDKADEKGKRKLESDVLAEALTMPEGTEARELAEKIKAENGNAALGGGIVKNLYLALLDARKTAEAIRRIESASGKENENVAKAVVYSDSEKALIEQGVKPELARKGVTILTKLENGERLSSNEIDVLRSNDVLYGKTAEIIGLRAERTSMTAKGFREAVRGYSDSRQAELAAEVAKASAENGEMAARYEAEARAIESEIQAAKAEVRSGNAEASVAVSDTRADGNAVASEKASPVSDRTVKARAVSEAGGERASAVSEGAKFAEPSENVSVALGEAEAGTANVVNTANAVNTAEASRGETVTVDGEARRYASPAESVDVALSVGGSAQEKSVKAEQNAVKAEQNVAQEERKGDISENADEAERVGEDSVDVMSDGDTYGEPMGSVSEAMGDDVGGEVGIDTEGEASPKAEVTVKKKSSVWNRLARFFRTGETSVDIDSDGLTREKGINDSPTFVFGGKDRDVIREKAKSLGVRVSYVDDSTAYVSGKNVKGSASASGRDIRIFLDNIRREVKARAEANGEVLSEKELNERIAAEAVRVTYHEFGHIMEVYAKEAFADFKALAVARYKKQHGEEGFNRAWSELNRNEGRELEKGEVESELACDMIPELLEDKAFISLFGKQMRRDSKAFGRFLNAVGELLSRVRNFFESLGFTKRTDDEVALRSLYIFLRKSFNRASAEYRRQERQGVVAGTVVFDKKTGEVLRRNEERKGERYSTEGAKKIYLGMSDEDRAEVLKKTYVTIVTKDNVDKDMLERDISLIKNEKEKQDNILLEVAKKYGVIKTGNNALEDNTKGFYHINDIGLDVEFSINSMRESANKQNDDELFVRMFPYFKEIVENAKLIKQSKDRYYKVLYPTKEVEKMYVLCSAFRDKDGITSIVKLEVKKFINPKTNNLYVVVTLYNNLKEKKEEAPSLSYPEASTTLRRNKLSSASALSIPQILESLQTNCNGFVKYFPDSLLNAAQKKKKKEELVEEQNYIQIKAKRMWDKKDKKYETSVTQGNEKRAIAHLKYAQAMRGYDIDNGDGTVMNSENFDSPLKLSKITYNDDGVLIPLSKRYDVSNKDERYSTVDTRKLGEEFDREKEKGAVTDGAAGDGEGLDAEGVGDVENPEVGGVNVGDVGNDGNGEVGDGDGGDGGEVGDGERILPEYNSKGQKVSKFAETVARDAEYLKGTDKDDVGRAYSSAARNIAENPVEYKTEPMSHKDTAKRAEAVREEDSGGTDGKTAIIKAIERYNTILGNTEKIEVLSTEDFYNVLYYLEEARKLGLDNERDELLAIAAENASRSGRNVELAKVLGEMTGASYEKYMRRKEENINRSRRGKIFTGAKKKLFDEAVKLGNEKREREAMLEKVKAKLAKVTEKYLKAQEEIARLKAERDSEYSSALREAEDKLESLGNELKAAKEEAKKAREAADKARRELKEARKELDKMPIVDSEGYGDIDSAKGDVRRKLAEARGLRKRISNIEGMISSKEDGDAKKAELEKRVEDLKKELKDKEDELRAAGGTPEQAEAIRKLIDKEQRLENKIKKLSEAYELKDEELGKKEQRISELEAEIQSIYNGDGERMGLTELRRKVASAKGKEQRRTERVERLTEELERKQAEIDEIAAKNPEYEKMIAEEKRLKKKVDYLQKQIDNFVDESGKPINVKEEIEKLNAEIKSKRAEMSELIKQNPELAELLKKQKALKSEIRKIEEVTGGNAKENLEKRIAELNESLAKNQAELEKYMAEHPDYENLVAVEKKLNKRLDAIQKQIDRFKDESGNPVDIQAEIDRLNAEIEEKRAERRALAEQMPELAELFNAERRLKSEIREIEDYKSGKAQEKAQKRIDKLNEKLAKLEAEYASFAEDKAKVQKEVEDAKKKVNEKFADLAVLKNINRKLGANAPVFINANLIAQYRNAEDADERQKIAQTIVNELISEIPHASFLERLEAWKHVCMLGSIKTPERNLYSNTVNYILTGVNDRIATVIETMYYKISGNKDFERTKASAWSKLMYSEGVDNYFAALLKKGARRVGEVVHPIRTVKGLLGNNLHTEAERESKFRSEVLEFLEKDADMMQGVLQGKEIGDGKGDDIVNMFNEQRRIFKWGYHEKLRKAVNASLETPDLWFLRSAYKSSLLSALAARKIDISDLSSKDEKVRSAAEAALASARDYAVRRAKEVTFREQNWLADKINEVKKTTIGKLIFEPMITYVKTPANVAKQSFLNSPISFGAALYNALSAKGAKGDIMRAEKTGNEAGAVEARAKYQTAVEKVIEDTAKGFTGTALCFAGYMLSKGIEIMGAKITLRFGGGDDDDYEDLLGYQDMSFNLEFGDKKYSISLSQFSPAVVPLLIGSLFRERMSEDNKEVSDNILGALWGGSWEFATAFLKVLVDTTMLSNVDDFISDLQNMQGYTKNDDGLNVMDAGLTLALGYLQQFLVPTYISHLTKALAGSGMRSYKDTERDSSGFYRAVQKRFINKIGGLGNVVASVADYTGWEVAERLATFKYVDEWGRTSGNDSIIGGVASIVSGKYSDGAVEILKAMGIEIAMPFFASEVIETEADKEILRLREALGTSVYIEGENSYGIYPETAKKTVDFLGGSVRFSAREYEQFATVKGKTQRELIEAAVGREDYQRLSDGEKAKIIDKIYNLAEKIAAKEVIGDKYASGDNVYNTAVGRDMGGMLDILLYENALSEYKADTGDAPSEKEKTGILLGLGYGAESAVGIWRSMVYTEDEKLGELVDKLNPSEAVDVLKYYNKIGIEGAESETRKAEELLKMGLSDKMTEGIWKAHIGSEKRIELYDMLKSEGLIRNATEGVKLFAEYPGDGYDISLKLKDEGREAVITEILGEKASVVMDDTGTFTAAEYNKRYRKTLAEKLGGLLESYKIIKPSENASEVEVNDYLRNIADAIEEEVQFAKTVTEGEMLADYIKGGGTITIKTSTGEEGELSAKASEYYWRGIEEDYDGYKPSAALATYDKNGCVKYGGVVYTHLVKGKFDTKRYADYYVYYYVQEFNKVADKIIAGAGTPAAEKAFENARKNAKNQALRATDEYYKNRSAEYARANRK